MLENPYVAIGFEDTLRVAEIMQLSLCGGHVDHSGRKLAVDQDAAATVFPRIF
jgi:hypothetical protein